MDGTFVGYLHEDGYLKNTSGPLGQADGLRPIEDVPGCIFRGIDSNGMELVLPGSQVGPTGTLTFNNIMFNVINGRLSTPDHRLVGRYDDDGTIYIRDGLHRVQERQLDETTQLNTAFAGIKSTGDKFKHEYIRPLNRKDRSYCDNEIIRYFEDFDKLHTAQKKYVMESLNLWAGTGLLQIVRKSEGTAALGPVKHGAAGVTGVRTGIVTLDQEEFVKEITLYKKFGPIAVVLAKTKPYTEVRVNLVVAHEFGHQLWFVLSQKTQQRFIELYDQRRKHCDRVHPLPSEYDGLSELITRDQVYQRIFISGYARHSEFEYWSECTAAFSVKASRDILKQIDPDAYEILKELVCHPENLIRPVFHDTILALKASLRLGGELKDDFLS